MDRLLHGPLREKRASAAIAALFFPSAISRRTSRSRGVSSSERRLFARCLGGHETSTTSDRKTDKPASNREDRLDELVYVLHALLQQICPSGGTGIEERERIAGFGVLAEDDDAGLKDTSS